jgi:hypothetical protein
MELVLHHHLQHLAHYGAGVLTALGPTGRIAGLTFLELGIGIWKCAGLEKAAHAPAAPPALAASTR